MKYCVLNERGTFRAKMFSHYTDIVIFVLVYFVPTHPVDAYWDGCTIGYVCIALKYNEQLSTVTSNMLT